MDGLMGDLAQTDAAAGSNERKLADYAHAFMDQAGIEQRRLPALKADLGRIGAIADKKRAGAGVGATIRADVDPLNATNLQTENLFGVFVTQSMSDPSKNVPYLLQGGLGMPDRDYYLSADPEMAKIRDAYKPYHRQDAGCGRARPTPMRGPSGSTTWKPRSPQAHATIVDTEDMHKANNPGARPISPRRRRGSTGRASSRRAQLSTEPNDSSSGTRTRSRKLSALVASEPLEAWKDWLAFHQIDQARTVLPTKMRQG